MGLNLLPLLHPPAEEHVMLALTPSSKAELTRTLRERHASLRRLVAQEFADGRNASAAALTRQAADVRAIMREIGA